jgi:hypothetical protein
MRYRYVSVSMGMACFLVPLEAFVVLGNVVHAFVLALGLNRGHLHH